MPDSASSHAVADARRHVVERLEETGLVRFRPGADEVVYHYTDVEAVLAILEQGTLRASSVTHLNDRMEYRLGASRFAEALRDTRAPGVAVIRDRVLDEMDDERAQLRRRLDVFNCSFSYEGDLLSQWRGYARDGTGYAIGFDARALADLLRPAGWTYRVVYDEEAQREIARVTLDAFWNWRAGSGLPDDAAAGLAYDVIGVLSPMMKHPGYSEEVEFRYVVHQQHGRHRDRLRVRARGGGLVPYLELYTARRDAASGGEVPVALPIRRIVVGPCHDFAKEAHCLRILLEQQGLGGGDVEIASSKVPYLMRPW
ncbi:MAG TPA: DUF2971 domain-containing protein [Armatimonadaceae bacterium]|nr:DUF2971 domain-containing protein [Armatimonadaceae bacterium]